VAEEKPTYADFETNDVCAECHTDIAAQYEQSVMSKSFTHKWDEVEYYELALPHSGKDEKVAGIKGGCMGCHSPLAFITGDIPPKRPAENTRANDGVSCDLCHSITGMEGDVPFNFNFKVDGKGPKQGTREGVSSGGEHEIAVNPFLETAEFCGVCHNEKDPYDQWVKATQLEWKESPQGKAGIVCQDCHMPPAESNPATGGDGKVHADTRQHLFNGSHDNAKLKGSIEVLIHTTTPKAKAGDTATFMATVTNAKAGHMIPSGSAEERVVWLDVVAVDAAGKKYPLAVDPKGFENEDMTIASADALAYQDLGEIQGIKDFKGLERDGQVPAGDRIFRLPYLDPKGRMTVAQWNTASFGPDYRLAPLEAKNETYTWILPRGVNGPVTVTATVYYSRLVSSVADHLDIPKEEWAAVEVSSNSVTLNIPKK